MVDRPDASNHQHRRRAGLKRRYEESRPTAVHPGKPWKHGEEGDQVAKSVTVFLTGSLLLADVTGGGAGDRWVPGHEDR